MKRVLVIDDEPQIRRLLKISLGAKGYDVHEAATGYEGIQAITGVRPDIILLDLNLPDMEGAKVLADIRTWSSLPVIILSVRKTAGDIVALLDAGADDYLSKPFNVEELLARMNVAQRRSRPDIRETSFCAGNLTVDFEERAVSVEGREVKLTPTEYSILAFLARNGGKIVTQSQLLRELWGPASDLDTGSLRVHISSLRKKIERESSRPEYLVTEPGIGYRLCGK